MKTVTGTRTVVVVGKRPRRSAAELLGDVPPGGEAVVLVLGLTPTPQQRRLTELALAMAAERRFILTAELAPAPSWLRDRLRAGDDIRVVARPIETRRWGIASDRPLSARDER